MKHFKAGGEYSLASSMYPSVAKFRTSFYQVPEFATAYGYTHSDGVAVDGVIIPKNTAFCALNDVGGGDFSVFVRYGFRGQRVYGVDVEQQGRVQYIDGCTDSILIQPPRQGDPCLNSLHFPAGVDQTFHTHPSVRIGVVARGSGFACTKDGEVELNEGDGWIIETNEVHRFRTVDSEMVVIAYHPDSDWGATDQAHPMINRTYIK